MLDGERFSGAAHASHDFVGDQEHSIRTADFRDARNVAFGRYGRAKSCANNRLENKRGRLLTLFPT